MTKWEYTLEDVSQLAALAETDPKDTDAQSAVVMSRLAELGEEGWEFCWNDPPYFMFKRVKHVQVYVNL